MPRWNLVLLGMVVGPVAGLGLVWMLDRNGADTAFDAVVQPEKHPIVWCVIAFFTAVGGAVGLFVPTDASKGRNPEPAVTQSQRSQGLFPNGEGEVPAEPSGRKPLDEMGSAKAELSHGDHSRSNLKTVSDWKMTALVVCSVVFPVLLGVGILGAPEAAAEQILAAVVGCVYAVYVAPVYLSGLKAKSLQARILTTASLLFLVALVLPSAADRGHPWPLVPGWGAAAWSAVFAVLSIAQSWAEPQAVYFPVITIGNALAIAAPAIARHGGWQRRPRIGSTLAICAIAAWLTPLLEFTVGIGYFVWSASLCCFAAGFLISGPNELRQ